MKRNNLTIQQEQFLIHIRDTNFIDKHWIEFPDSAWTKGTLLTWLDEVISQKYYTEFGSFLGDKRWLLAVRSRYIELKGKKIS